MMKAPTGRGVTNSAIISILGYWLGDHIGRLAVDYPVDAWAVRSAGSNVPVEWGEYVRRATTLPGHWWLIILGGGLIGLVSAGISSGKLGKWWLLPAGVWPLAYHFARYLPNMKDESFWQYAVAGVLSILAVGLIRFGLAYAASRFYLGRAELP